MTMVGIGESYVPSQVRLMLALLISITIASALDPKIFHDLPADNPLTLPIVLTELLYGFFCGTLIRIIFLSLESAGHIIDMQLSLGQGSIFNPASMQPGAVSGGLLTAGGLALFFVTDLHHLVIKGIMHSYELFPPNTFGSNEAINDYYIRMFASSFNLALHISMPLIIIGLALFLGMGLLNRILPQIPIFFLSHPIQIVLGLILFLLSIEGAMREFIQFIGFKVNDVFGLYIVD